MKTNQIILLLLSISMTIAHNPVYNIQEDDPMKNPNNPLVPQLTTNYEQMMIDRSKRLITIGEPQKDPLRHVEFSPVHHYDEEVEFVSDIKPVKIIQQAPLDDKDVLFKTTELEQMIYSLYEIKNESEKQEFLRGEESPIDQFLTIIGNANQGLSLQEIHVLDKIRQLIVFLRKKEESFKGLGQSDGLAKIQKKVKHLSFLIDQRDWQNKIVQSLDTDIFTYNRTMAQLDAPVQYYASRVSFLIKKGQVYDLAAYIDISNFNYFAQRKSKQQMIYRKMSIIRAKNMTGDLEGQQNAVINLLQELSNELKTCEEAMRPLNQLQNQIAIIAPQENIQKINQVMQNCVDNMNRYPEIQFICTQILQQHDFSTVNTFKKLVFMIKQEVASYELSMSSLITQIQLGRAAQDAVNLRYVSNVYQNLNRMATECSNNQKKISANEKITDYIQTINTFRSKNQTLLLAIQNIENVIFETNKGTFWNSNDAQLKEFQDGNDHFNIKLNTQRMLADKLGELAGKLAIETTPENSHQAEELMETLVNFMQRQEKLTEIIRLLDQSQFSRIKELLLQELNQLAERQLNFEDILTRLGDLEVLLYQMDLKSAQEKVKSLTKEKWLRAMPKMRMDQAYGQLVIGERRMAAGYLADAQQELNANLQHIIGSQRDVNEQMMLLIKITTGEDIAIGQDPAKDIKTIIEITQDIVIFDAALEDTLTTVRLQLLDGKGKDASDKISALINKDHDHKHEVEITTDDIKQLSELTKQDFEEDDYDVANRHSEQLVQLIQQAEKQSDIIYTIRAVLQFNKQSKKNAVLQAVEDLKVSIQKEFFAIENKQKLMEKINKMIKKLLDSKNTTNVQFNQILFDIKNKVYINNRFFDMAKMAIQLSQNNDQTGARSTLKELSGMIKRDISDLEVSKDLVDQQQQLLAEELSDLDNAETFHLLEKVQQLSRQQVNVMTDESLNIKQNEFVGYRNERNHLQSLKVLDDITSKGINYIQLIDEKIMDLKDVIDPQTVIKMDAKESDIKIQKITPVQVVYDQQAEKKNVRTQSKKKINKKSTKQ